MGRKPIDGYTRSRIGVLRGEGKKLDEIWFKVKSAETGFPERRTVARYIKRFDELDSEESSWSWISDAHINKISNAECLLECKYVWDSKLKEDPDIGQFTLRMAKWCWLIRHAYKRFSYNDLFSVASAYAHEERITILDNAISSSGNDYRMLFNSKKNNVLNFLDGLLTYKPWKSDKRRLELVAALNSKKVEFPESSPEWSIFAFCLGTDIKNDLFRWKTPNRVVPFPPAVFGRKNEWYKQLRKVIGH